MAETLIGELGCKNCRHAWREPAGQLICRAHPPVAFAFPAPGGMGIGAAFPPVQPDQKCGEHERGVVLGG
ncbi:MAG TPA: hypothetical protein VEF36_07855 [Roseiarcus sp.]|nr:hypothetical protein [Roseiarcus sp.]